MRGSSFAVVAALTTLVAGCDKLPNMGKPATPAPVAAATPPPAALPVAVEPAPAASPETAAVGTAASAAMPAPIQSQAAAPAPKVEAVRFSRTDYSARERRLAALIANAETRDTSGETQYRAQRGEAERQRCATKACIERSYATEEAWMRKWEGS